MTNESSWKEYSRNKVHIFLVRKEEGRSFYNIVPLSYTGDYDSLGGYGDPLSICKMKGYAGNMFTVCQKGEPSYHWENMRIESYTETYTETNLTPGTSFVTPEVTWEIIDTTPYVVVFKMFHGGYADVDDDGKVVRHWRRKGDFLSLVNRASENGRLKVERKQV